MSIPLFTIHTHLYDTIQNKKEFQSKGVIVKKIHILTLLLLPALLFSATQLFARSSAVVYSQNYQIDQDLDLNAVASLFGDSRDLYDFERRLNDPSYQISNLDLNNDGYVDYLRVIETVDGNFHLIVIQAVIGNRRYQDIATIEVNKSYNQTYVQVVGNTYIYGPNYIIEPNYSYIPQIFRTFWQPRFYHAYRSDYRWRHYPSHYRPWRPVPVPYYHRHIRKHISHRNSYRYTKHRRAKYPGKVHNRVKRNDYAKRYPNRSHKRRTSHKKSIKQRGRDRNRTYRQKERAKKTSHRPVNSSATLKTRTHNTINRPVSRSAVKDRTQDRSTSRSAIKTRTHSRSRSRSEVKKRSQYRKDVKKTIRPTDRHINRQKIQQRSLSRERRQ